MFAHFPHLLTEILLRLVYQTEKIRTSSTYVSTASAKDATSADSTGVSAAPAPAVSTLRRVGGDSVSVLPEGALRFDGEMASSVEASSGPECWEQLLSEYMSRTSVSSVIRRQVRKVRQAVDLHVS